MLSASCHCGAIHLEFDEKPQTLTGCTCSICHRLGAQWAYYTVRRFDGAETWKFLDE